jgi:hypothetical protein
MVSIVSKELVYGILTIVIILGVVGTFMFIPQAKTKFDELIGQFDILLPQEVRDAEDEFELYFEDQFVDYFVDCRDSANMNCWCTDDTFRIPSQFSVKIYEKRGVRMELKNNKGSTFAEYVFSNVQPCLIVDQGEYSMAELNGGYFTLKGGGLSPSSVAFVTNQPVNIPSGGGSSGTTGGGVSHPGQTALQYSPQTDFQNPIDLDYLFYKTTSGEICVMDNVRADQYKTTIGKC